VKKICFLILLLTALMARAETLEVELVLKEHLFTPSQLILPAGKKIKLLIHNQDTSPEEFESFSLNREKVILGEATGVVFLGPLEPGEHTFSGEYNPDTARGLIKVVPLSEWQAEAANAH
jgi:hypothetical protein